VTIADDPIAEAAFVSRARTPRWRAWGDVAVGGLVVAFFALTFWLAATLNIWQDEWYSLRTTSRDLGFAWTTALQFESIPPLYPLVLDLWRHANGSVFFARSLSIVCVAATAFLGWRFTGRHLPRVPPAAVAAALAFNPFSIFAAVEIRLYAMALLLSAAFVATFFSAFMDVAPKPRDRIVFAVVAIVAVYVQYFNAVLLVGGFLALLILRRRRALRTYALASIVVVAVCSPIASFIAHQLDVPRSLEAQRVELLPIVETAFSFAFPHGAFVNWFSDRRNLAYDLGVFFAIASILGARPRLTASVRALSVFIITGIAFYPVATIVLHQTFVFPRHAVVLVVPVVLVVFAVLDGIEMRRTFARSAYLLVYALCTVAALVVTYRGLAKPGDFRRAATFVREHARASERVYAFDQEMAGPLAFYDLGPHTIVPLPAPQHFDRFDVRRFSFRSVAEVRARLGSIQPGTHLMLYRGDVCYDIADQYGCRFLEEVVRSDFRTVASIELDSANVRELVRL